MSSARSPIAPRAAARRVGARTPRRAGALETRRAECGEASGKSKLEGRAKATAEEIAGLASRLARRYEFGAISELKTAPRGYPKDHPRIELLRRKGLIASKDFGAPKWLHTKQAASKVRALEPAAMQPELQDRLRALGYVD